MEAGVHNTKFPRLKQAFREGQALLAEAEAYWAIVRGEATVHLQLSAGGRRKREPWGVTLGFAARYRKLLTRYLQDSPDSRGVLDVLAFRLLARRSPPPSLVTAK